MKAATRIGLFDVFGSKMGVIGITRPHSFEYERWRLDEGLFMVKL
jgi:hypothetical protein